MKSSDSTMMQKSLYDRLGGVYNIATVVDDLIDRLMVDPRLNANPRVAEAHHRVSPAGFKFLATELVCQAAGGPQTYSGRSMGDSHRHLMITGGEWEAFLDDFRDWPTRLFPGVRDMLTLLAQRCTLACLSNTNSVHWPHVRDTLGLSGLLHRYYLSHEIGHLKPTHAAFEHVLADLGCAPASVVFLDDNQLNVEAAQAVGIQAYRTVGIAEVQTALRSLGLLGPS